MTPAHDSSENHANTTFDAEETARRRKDTAPQVTTTGDRFISEGDILVQAHKRMTPDDIYLLEQMYSLIRTRPAYAAPAE